MANSEEKVMRTSLRIVLLLGLVFSLGACSKKSGGDDPKERLRDYISKSFSIRSPADRDELVSYLVGDAKIRLAAWSEEQFLQAFVDSKREFVKLAFKEVEKRSPQEVAITYELTYLDQSRGTDAKVTHKKLAQMVQREGRWYIAEVRNIKELVEFRNEMSIP